MGAVDRLARKDRAETRRLGDIAEFPPCLDQEVVAIVANDVLQQHVPRCTKLHQKFPALDAANPDLGRRLLAETLWPQHRPSQFSRAQPLKLYLPTILFLQFRPPETDERRV